MACFCHISDKLGVRDAIDIDKGQNGTACLGRPRIARGGQGKLPIGAGDLDLMDGKWRVGQSVVWIILHGGDHQLTWGHGLRGQATDNIMKMRLTAAGDGQNGYCLLYTSDAADE